MIYRRLPLPVLLDEYRSQYGGMICAQLARLNQVLVTCHLIPIFCGRFHVNRFLCPFVCLVHQQAAAGMGEVEMLSILSKRRVKGRGAIGPRVDEPGPYLPEPSAGHGV